jgi:RimJ/RimL family protein N-acetyltransferase/catechol 2,3-dioxygenase-like lactoylglutathione lyase family enzyme
LANNIVDASRITVHEKDHPMTVTTLHTDRLILRPITADDLPAFFAIFSNGEAMRFMPSLPHSRIEDTRAWFETEVSRPGEDHWAVCLKDNGAVIGHVNYLQTRIPGMGYILHPDYWGQGYTVEAARAALEYGFDHLGYERVELWIDDTNTRSMRVAQKLGFGIKGRIALRYRHEARHHHMFVYGMRAHEWRGEAEPADPPSFFKMEPALLVHNLRESVDFYVDKLGFQLDFLFGDPPFHAGVSRGEWTGNLVTIQLSQVPPEREIQPSAYLYIFTDNRIDELCAVYRARGVEIVSDPEDEPWGIREFSIRDLDGHRLVFGTFI